MKKTILSLAIIIGLAGCNYSNNTLSTSEEKSTTKNTVSTSNKSDNSENLREIVIQAKRFEFTPNEITLKKGEKVKLILNNLDTKHSIKFDNLNLQGEKEVIFEANQVGEFDFHCNTFCGSGHAEMRGKVIVVDDQNITSPEKEEITQGANAANFSGEKGQNIQIADEKITIDSASVSDGNAHFFNAILPNGNIVYFFVVKSPDGALRAAANACQVCGSSLKGFRQEGDSMVCNNCGNVYSLNKIATEKGGCNPVPINPDLKVNNGKIEIPLKDLEKIEQFFK